MDDVGRGCEQRREVQLEAAPASSDERRVELADPARVDACGLARMQKRLRERLDVQLGLERFVQRLDGALRAREAARADGADAPALLRQLFAAREIDARDLEQRDVVGTGIEVPLRRLDQAAP